MKTICISAAMICAATSSLTRAVTVDFADLPIGASSSSASHYNGSDSGGGFTSRQTFFNNNYDTTFDSWDGWSYSNVVDTADAGFTNQYASFAGGGSSASGATVAGDAYGVAYSGYPNDSYINLPAGQLAQSVRLTNTTYAGISMRDGDRFTKKFVAGDYFDVVLTGFSLPNAAGETTGSVTFYLGDFRDGKSLIVSDWTLVNLTTLGSAASIGLTFESSDVGQFGINTPTYVALDNLFVPEPASLAGVSLSLLLMKRRRAM